MEKLSLSFCLVLCWKLDVGPHKVVIEDINACVNCVDNGSITNVVCIIFDSVEGIPGQKEQENENLLTRQQ